jgi:hypothetical protein
LARRGLTIPGGGDGSQKSQSRRDSMFGTIGHVRPKAGTEAQYLELMEEWKRTVRPKIPGRFISIEGRPKDRPGEIVFIALAQDEATYRMLAELPEQDAFYRKLTELMGAEPTWEDVEMEVGIND